MSKIASGLGILTAILVLSLPGTGQAGGLMSADEGVNSFLDQPTVSYPSDHGYLRVNWFVGYDPIYGSCSANIWNGYCPKKCHGPGNRCGHGRCGGCR